MRNLPHHLFYIDPDEHPRLNYQAPKGIFVQRYTYSSSIRFCSSGSTTEFRAIIPLAAATAASGNEATSLGPEQSGGCRSDVEKTQLEQQNRVKSFQAEKWTQRQPLPNGAYENARPWSFSPPRRTELRGARQCSLRVRKLHQCTLSPRLILSLLRAFTGMLHCRTR